MRDADSLHFMMDNLPHFSFFLLSSGNIGVRPRAPFPVHSHLRLTLTLGQSLLLLPDDQVIGGEKEHWQPNAPKPLDSPCLLSSTCIWQEACPAGVTMQEALSLPSQRPWRGKHYLINCIRLTPALPITVNKASILMITIRAVIRRWRNLEKQMLNCCW